MLHGFPPYATTQHIRFPRPADWYATWRHLNQPTLWVLLWGLMSSWAIYQLGDAWELRDRAANLQRTLVFYGDAIQEELENLATQVQAIGQLYAASESVNAEEFTRFAAPFLTDGGVLRAFAWVPASSIEGSIDSPGPTPPVRGGGEIAQHFPLEQLESRAGSTKLLSLQLDLDADPNGYAILERNFGKGRPTILLPFVRSAADTNLGHKFLIVTSPYWAAESPPTLLPMGFAVGLACLGQVVESVIKRFPLAGDNVDLLLQDPSSPGSAGWLYLHAGGTRTTDNPLQGSAFAQARLNARFDVQVGGRKLSLHAMPAPGTDATPLWLNLLLILGLTLTATLGALTHLMLQRREARLLREKLAFQYTVLNSMDTPLAVLDQYGTLLAANEAWRRFAQNNDGTPTVVPADPWLYYLAACGLDTVAETQVAAGIQAVLDAQQARFVYEYPCPAAARVPTRWFSMRVTRFDGEFRGVVIAHADITGPKQAEASARCNEKRFQDIAEVSGDWIWEIDAAGPYTYASASVYDLLGYRPEELVNQRTRFDLMPAEDAQQMASECAALTVQGQSFHDRLSRMCHRDGSLRYVLSSGVPIMDEAGGLLGYRGIDKDVTELHQARQALEHHRDWLEQQVQHGMIELAASEAKFRGLVEQSLAGIFILQESRFCYVNPGFAQMHGFNTPDEIIGRVTPLELAAPEAREVIQAQAHRAYTSKESGRQFTYAGLRRDGTRIDLELHGRIIEYQGRPALIGLVLDISERTRAQQTREAILATAEQLTRLKRQFIDNMNHELRTPLNAIIGLAQLGQRAKDLDKAHANYTKILQAGQQLLSMVQDILDFSRIETDPFICNPVPCDLLQVLDPIVATATEQAQAKGLIFQDERAPDLPRYCELDGRRVAQVLSHLLANAVKFTEQGQISFAAHCTDASLWLQVTDTGIGMPPEHLTYLFRPFEQGDGSSTRRFGGLGLGLALNHHLVRKMNGRLDVTSTLGQGSCFRVRLPLITVNRDDIATAQLPRLPLAGYQLLAVSDCEISRFILAEILETAGADVTLTAHVMEAAAHLRQVGVSAYDLVFIELQPSGQDNSELLSEIKLLAPALPLVGLVSEAQPKQWQACMADCLVKPICPDLIVERVLHLARRRKPVAFAAHQEDDRN